MSEEIFPASEQMPTKTKRQTGLEEDALTAFALHRAMLGQSPKGICATVSHVRTWHETIFKEELGRVGMRSKASPTSQHIKAMKGYYTIKGHSCVKRRPMNRDLVRLVLIESRKSGRDDVGVAVLTAFAGLFRMGELAASDGACDPIEDMAERDLKFVPNFWNATKVIINMGRSKADQDGARSKLRPRILPVNEDLMSPGRALRDLIAERHGCRMGRTPTLGTTPLFQDDSGGQLKMSAVLTQMRRILQRKGGMSEHEASEFGTHSCRMGGVTALFQLGATPGVFKHLGGWSSDACELHVQMQQSDLMRCTRLTCETPAEL
jgi:hypothetical protein